jgi:hypothetical protein
MRRKLLAVLAAALAGGGAAAEGLPLEGSLRGAWYSSSARHDERDDVASAALWLKTAPQLTDQLKLVAEGWVRNDDALDSAGRTSATLREAYLQASAGQFDLRVGQQLIVWGRADRVNPTDNVTRRDYTLLTPEDVDQRRGILAAQLRYRLPQASLMAYWLPQFRPNRVPLPALPGVSWREEVPHARQGAVKIDASGGAVDWSLSYYNGLDVNADLALGRPTPQGMELVLTHHRVRILGMDAATVAGRYGLRAEAAYTWTDDGGDPLRKKPFLYLVAGGDRTWGEHFNINLQVYARRVSGYRDPRLLSDPLLRNIAAQGALAAGQLERSEHGITYRIANKWLNETLEAELAGVISLSRNAYAFKPRLSYAIDDHWRVTAGMNWYRGKADTFFGQLAATSAGFIELKYSF